MILASYQLCSYNVTYNTSLLLEQVCRGYNQAPEKYSGVNIEVSIFEIPNLRFGTIFQNPVT